MSSAPNTQVVQGGGAVEQQRGGSASSVSSFQSTLSRIRMKTLQTEDELATMQKEYADKEAALEEQRDAFIDQLDLKPTPEHRERLQAEIAKIDQRLIRLTARYNKRRMAYEKCITASKKLEEAQRNSDQELDSGDEAAVSANATVEEAKPVVANPIGADKPECGNGNSKVVNPVVIPEVHTSEVKIAGVTMTRSAVGASLPLKTSRQTESYSDSDSDSSEQEVKTNERRFKGRRSEVVFPPRNHKMQPEEPWRNYGAHQDFDEQRRQWSDERYYPPQPFYNEQQQQAQHFRPEAPEFHPRQNDETSIIRSFTTVLEKSLGNRGSSFEKKLPEFDGDPGQWENFRACFERTTKKFNIENSENMSRLQQALKGEARSAVAHLMANVANVDVIFKKLKSRFGRPEFVLDYLVEQVKASKPPDLSKPKTIVDFGTAVEALVTNVVAFNEEEYLFNKQLVTELVDKLPDRMVESWYEWLFEDESRKPNLKFFWRWLEVKMNVAQLRIKPTSTVEPSKENRKEGKRSKRNLGIHAAEKEQKSEKCPGCEKENHGIAKCFKFKKMKSRERKAIVRKNSLCFQCLGKGHRSPECTHPVKCDVKDCDHPSSHHPLLHLTVKEKESTSSTTEKEEKPKESETVKEMNAISSRANILPIIPVYLRGPKGKIKVFALLDSGSSFCALEEDVANKLGLEGKEQTLRYKVYGDSRVENSREISLEISGDYDRAPFYQIKRASTVKRMKLSPRSLDAEQMKNKFPHLEKMRTRSIKDARPQLVLGTNVGGLFAAREILENSPGEVPAAVRSLLGWYIIEDEESAEKCVQFALRDQTMHDDIREFIAIENLGVKEQPSSRSKEDKKALKFMESNTRKVGNSWITSLPWRYEDESLPPSRQMALKRLYAMERKMDKDKEFATLCCEKFSEYIDKGYLKKVKAPLVNDKKQWFLPWFFANHPNKKPRLVFDAAAKSCGKSFNDFLLTGPDFLRPLYSVLVRFRRHQIALTADVQAMFHQVKLDDRDHPSQTVLFRGQRREGEPDQYQMTVLFFGAAPSPSLACYVRNRNAEQFERKYPVAVKAALWDTYMDDCLTGAESTEDAIRLQNELVLIHSSGGFPLVKWTSSSSSVMDRIPENVKAEGSIKLQNKNEEHWEKTLGLLWNPETDEFSFSLSTGKIPQPILNCVQISSKRIVTSVVMSVFDPLGFLSSLKVKGMLIIQKIWRSGIGWDDQISENIFSSWKAWMEELKEAVLIRIPRKLCPVSIRSVESTQLHVFCDASEDAYACAAYLRLQTRGSIYTPFVMGKVRVAPMKGLTIPRMELNAALIGTRIAKAVRESFGEDLKFDAEFFWSDSRTVLTWIRSVDKRYKPYVSNRVGEILENSDPASWKWVPTADNVADDATRTNRGGTKTESRWLTGPTFLQEQEDKWPQEVREQANPEDLEEKTIQVAEKETKPDLYLPEKEKYSSWYRLIRATAARFAAARKIMSLKEFKGKPKPPFRMNVDDLKKAEILWIKNHQRKYFCEELSALTSGVSIHKSSRLWKLSPGLNSDGIIVLKGRLEKAEVEESLKQPPILDPTDWYVKLMIKWFHKISQHFGQERIVNELRKKVWIIGVRGAVKKCKSECLVCKRNSSKPIPPEMGQLPICRVQDGKPPFYHTGVDYFGPMFVKSGRKTLKRWGVLFTCLTIRAVHLELAESLETSEFLSCLARFINLRGTPRHIWSDNGTNFVGAEREIYENLKSWSQEEIRDKLLVREIDWHFIPPSSPHMGGAWERLIRTTKKILMALLKTQTPSDSNLRTLLTEVGSIMNSRPLTTTSSDAEDAACLTPNDLLQIKSVVGPSIPGSFGENDRYRETWKKGQSLANEFWKRWSEEYLPWLATRQKWYHKIEPLKEGDIVLVFEDNAPRNLWRKGLITRTFPSKDGQVRYAEVKVARVEPDDPKNNVKVSYYKRPVVKLCPLISKN